MEQINRKEAHELVLEIKESDAWQVELGHDSLEYKLCSLAGLGEEFDVEDGDDFESVIYKVADVLGVDVL